MTPKQQSFADYYIETGNASDSAKRAGYSERYINTNASKLLQNTTVKAYIGEAMDKLASKRIMGATEALELLSSIARAELQEEVVLSGFDGVEKVEKIPDIRDRQRAAEELLKRYTMGNNQDLRNSLLEAQIKKILAETKNEETGVTKITIVDEWDKDE